MLYSCTYHTWYGGCHRFGPKVPLYIEEWPPHLPQHGLVGLRPTLWPQEWVFGPGLANHCIPAPYPGFKDQAYEGLSRSRMTWNPSIRHELRMLGWVQSSLPFWREAASCRVSFPQLGGSLSMTSENNANKQRETEARRVKKDGRQKGARFHDIIWTLENNCAWSKLFLKHHKAGDGLLHHCIMILGRQSVLKKYLLNG